MRGIKIIISKFVLVQFDQRKLVDVVQVFTITSTGLRPAIELLTDRCHWHLR